MAEGRLPLIARSAEVVARLGDAALLPVDLGSAEQYLEAHLPGAVRLEFASLLMKQGDAGGLLPPVAELEALLGALGIDASRHVLAYDRDGGGRAARLVWTLHVLGFEQASILDGGLPAWVADGGAVQQEVVVPRASTFSARLPLARLETLDSVRDGLGKPGRVLLDTRSPAEYRGEDRRARHGGHIPGAVNWDWLRAMDAGAERRLRPEQAIRDELLALGVRPDMRVVAYCQTHHRSSHTYVVLRHLGYQDAAGYAGAWSEWGNRDDTPVELGAAGPAPGN